MSEEKKQLSEGAEKIVRAIVNQALARCEQLGIAWADFYRVMLEEQEQYPKITLPELIERVFARLEEPNN